MIHEIQAKVLLSHIRQPDPWFGLKYNMNIYRGCQHQCIYCDSRSECYQIEDFQDVIVKTNAVELLEKELARKKVKGMIGTGSMSDPYLPIEREYHLTARALQVIARRRFAVHILTKSDLVLRDLDILKAINQVHAVVSFTITTPHDDLAKKLEPGAPSPTQRFSAMQTLAKHGIHTGVLLMPVLPFIEDDPEDITQLVKMAKDHGAGYILASFGMTLRDRQRDYYYAQLEKHFPALRERYEKRFANRYGCPANNAAALQSHFNRLCTQLGISTQTSPV